MNWLLLNKKAILRSTKKESLYQNKYISPDLQAETVIKMYEQKNNDVIKEIQSNLSAQNNCLSERINVRRKSGRSRTYSPAFIPNHINLRNM